MWQSVTVQQNNLYRCLIHSEGVHSSQQRSFWLRERERASKKIRVFVTDESLKPRLAKEKPNNREHSKDGSDTRRSYRYGVRWSVRGGVVGPFWCRISKWFDWLTQIFVGGSDWWISFHSGFPVKGFFVSFQSGFPAKTLEDKQARTQVLIKLTIIDDLWAELSWAHSAWNLKSSVATMPPFTCKHERCMNERCDCLEKERNVASSQSVYCRHGTKLCGDPSKKEARCGCVHEDIIECGNPHNRDPMDPSWTYKGSRLKETLDKARKCPPSYCQHGKCVEGDEHGKSREYWSNYFTQKWNWSSAFPSMLTCRVTTDWKPCCFANHLLHLTC